MGQSLGRRRVCADFHLKSTKRTSAAKCGKLRADRAPDSSEAWSVFGVTPSAFRICSQEVVDELVNLSQYIIL